MALDVATLRATFVADTSQLQAALQQNQQLGQQFGQQMAGSMAPANAAAKELTDSVTKQVEPVKNLQAAHASAASALDGLTEKAKASVVEGTGLGQVWGQAQQALNAFTSGTAEAEGGLATVAAGMMAAAAAAVIAAAALVDIGAGWQETTTRIANAAQVSEEAASGIGAAMQDIAARTGQSQGELAAALADSAGKWELYSKSTLDAESATTLMTAASNLALASGQSLAASTSALVNVMTSFHVPVSDINLTMDQLYNASHLTGQGLDALAMEADRLAARMGATAPSVGEVMTGIIALNQAGAEGRMAISDYSMAVQTLTEPTKDATNTLDALGVKLTDENGNWVGMRETIATLAPVFDGLSTQQQEAAAKAIFGASASGAWIQVLRGGTDAWDAAATSANQTGTAEDAAALAADDLSAKWNAMKEQLLTGAAELGSRAVEGLVGLANAANDLGIALSGDTTEFGKLSQGAQDALGPILTLASAIGTANSALGTAGNWAVNNPLIMGSSPTRPQSGSLPWATASANAEANPMSGVTAGGGFSGGGEPQPAGAGPTNATAAANFRDLEQQSSDEGGKAAMAFGKAYTDSFAGVTGEGMQTAFDSVVAAMTSAKVPTDQITTLKAALMDAATAAGDNSAAVTAALTQIGQAEEAARAATAAQAQAQKDATAASKEATAQKQAEAAATKQIQDAAKELAASQVADAQAALQASQASTASALAAGDITKLQAAAMDAQAVAEEKLAEATANAQAAAAGSGAAAAQDAANKITAANQTAADTIAKAWQEAAAKQQAIDDAVVGDAQQATADVGSATQDMADKITANYAKAGDSIAKLQQQWANTTSLDALKAAAATAETGFDDLTKAQDAAATEQQKLSDQARQYAQQDQDRATAATNSTQDRATAQSRALADLQQAHHESLTKIEQSTHGAAEGAAIKAENEKFALDMQHLQQKDDRENQDAATKEARAAQAAATQRQRDIETAALQDQQAQAATARQQAATAADAAYKLTLEKALGIDQQSQQQQAHDLQIKAIQDAAAQQEVQDNLDLQRKLANVYAVELAKAQASAALNPSDTTTANIQALQDELDAINNGPLAAAQAALDQQTRTGVDLFNKPLTDSQAVADTWATKLAAAQADAKQAGDAAFTKTLADSAGVLANTQATAALLSGASGGSSSSGPVAAGPPISLTDWINRTRSATGLTPAAAPSLPAAPGATPAYYAAPVGSAAAPGGNGGSPSSPAVVQNFTGTVIGGSAALQELWSYLEPLVAAGMRSRQQGTGQP